MDLWGVIGTSILIVVPPVVGAFVLGFLLGLVAKNKKS